MRADAQPVHGMARAKLAPVVMQLLRLRSKLED